MGRKIYIVKVEEDSKYLTPSFENYPILQEYQDIFLKEFPRFPAKRRMDFAIELALRAKPISKATYRMNTNELQDLRM